MSTYYLGDQIAIVNSSGTFYETYFEDAGGRMLAKTDSSGTDYYHPDHLGSSRLVTNSSGDVVEKLAYLPFGADINSNVTQRFTFTGQEKDPESNLMYYGARYYNPNFRRFTQPDTLIPEIYNPQSLNRYSYVMNNPVKYTDPTGHTVDEKRIYNSFEEYQSDFNWFASQNPGWSTAKLHFEFSKLMGVAKGGDLDVNNPDQGEPIIYGKAYLRLPDGDVDLQHYHHNYALANLVNQETGNKEVTIFLCGIIGLGVEGKSAWTEYWDDRLFTGEYSGFAPEDIPSNAKGINDALINPSIKNSKDISLLDVLDLSQIYQYDNRYKKYSNGKTWGQIDDSND